MKLSKLYCIAAFIMCTVVNAQQADQWLPALASADGTNQYKGVEAFYSIRKCGKEEMLVIKLVNSNPFAINAHWKDLVVRSSGENVMRSKTPSSLKIGGGLAAEGDCSLNTPPLQFRLSDLKLQSAQLQEFRLSDFDFIEAKK